MKKRNVITAKFHEIVTRNLESSKKTLKDAEASERNKSNIELIAFLKSQIAISENILKDCVII